MGAGIANIDIGTDDSTEFAWSVLLGASYAINDRIDLSLGYRYLETTKPKLEIAGVGSGTLEGEATFHEILCGLRYNF